MKKNTEIDYKNAIRAKFEKEKVGDLHGFLSNPSPAQLRELCLLKYDQGLNKTDEVIFRLYFKISESEDLRNTIYNYHIPKFKSIGIFLNKNDKDANTNTLNLNLLAVLVDFNPRPYNKFNKSEVVKIEELSADLNNNEERDIVTFTNAIQNHNENNITNLRKGISIKNISVSILVVLFVFIVGYASSEYFFSNKCMQWNGTYYEKVNCDVEQNGIGSFAKVTPYDKSIFELKKIEVCDTTTCFIGDKPVVWYCTTNDEKEYFTSYGFHPVTGKALKPMTKYIYDKYVLPCE